MTKLKIHSDLFISITSQWFFSEVRWNLHRKSQNWFYDAYLYALLHSKNLIGTLEWYFHTVIDPQKKKKELQISSKGV